MEARSLDQIQPQHVRQAKLRRAGDQRSLGLDVHFDLFCVCLQIRHYYEFEVAPNNQWIDLEIARGEIPNHDASWNSGFAHAVHVDDKKHLWIVEMQIPLRPMGVSEIKPGKQWRANFFRAAGRGQDTQRKFLAWSTIPEGTTFHVPSRFGIVRFVD